MIYWRTPTLRQYRFVVCGLLSLWWHETYARECRSVGGWICLHSPFHDCKLPLVHLSLKNAVVFVSHGPMRATVLSTPIHKRFPKQSILFWCFCLVLGTTCVQLIKTNITVISNFPILRCKFWKLFTISSLWNMGIFIAHPRKLRFWTPKMEIWKIIFQFQRGDFPVSMLVFAGVQGGTWGFRSLPVAAEVPVKPPMAPPPQPPANNMVWFMGKEWSCFWWKMGHFQKGR